MAIELSIKESSTTTHVSISNYTITEALSELYRIEANIPLSAVSQKDVSTWIGCHCSLVDDHTDTTIQGQITDIEEDYSSEGSSLKLIIQPNLWVTTQDIASAVYQDKTTPELIKELLKPYASNQANTQTS